MKQLSKYFICFGLIVFVNSAFADDVDCKSVENYFQMDDDPRGCVYNNQVVKNPLFDFSELLKAKSYQACDLELKTTKRLSKQQDQCKRITSCFDEINNSAKANDKKLYCSMVNLSEVYESASHQDVILKVRKDFMDEKSDNFKLNQLMHAVAAQVGDLKDQINQCPVEEASADCLKDIPGVDMSLVSSIFNADAVSEMNSQIQKIYDRQSLNQLESINGRTKPPVAAAGNSALVFQTLLNFDVKGDRGKQGLIQSTSSTFSVSILKSEGREFVEKLAAEFGVDVKSIKDKYYDKDGKSKIAIIPDAPSYYLIDLVNSAARKKCSSTMSNNELVCRKVVQKYKDEIKRDKKSTKIVADYVRSSNNLALKRYNANLISILDVKYGFNLNNYLDLSSQYAYCVNNFGKDALEGKDAEQRLQSYITRAQNITQNLKQTADDKTKQSAKEIAVTLSDSDDATVRAAGKRFLDFSSSFKDTSDLRLDKNKYEDKILNRQSNPIAQSDSMISQNTLAPINKMIEDTAITNEVKNGISQFGKSVSTPPIQTPIVDYQPNEFESASNSQSIMKRISELEEKEKALKKKAEEKLATSGESEEMRQLRLQIEELKGQLAKKENVDALGNKIVSAKDANAATAATTSSKYPTATNITSSTSAIVSKRDSREPSGERETYAQTSSRSNFADNQNMGSQDIRVPASTVGAKSAIGSTAKSGSGAASAFGMVLTRNGEVTEDLTKIADNPKDADLIIMAEKSNGQPFIIRENGLLVQVVVEKDDAGKAIMENGKPKLKKIKLTKEKEALVAREFNVVREAKTVRDTVRLQELRRTTEDAVK